MPKPLRYTAHAETVRRERQLEREWIEGAVRSPEWSEIDPARPEADRRFRALPEREGRVLRVVCVETAGEIRKFRPSSTGRPGGRNETRRAV